MLNPTPHHAPRQPVPPPWNCSDDSRWLIGPPPSPAARLRLVCIPHAGGGASFFRPWAALLPAGVELWVAQLPGRENRHRDPATPDIAAAAQALAQSLRRLPDKPAILFGHSLGALIAYELALTMPQAGLRPPRLLAASGRTPPSDCNAPRHLLDLDDQALLDRLADRYDGIPPAILAHPELRELYAPVLRADLRLAAAYRHRPRPALDCPILALGGDRDANVAVSALAGWRGFTSSTFDTCVFPGGHFYLGDHAPAILQRLLSPLA